MIIGAALGVFVTLNFFPRQFEIFRTKVLGIEQTKIAQSISDTTSTIIDKTIKSDTAKPVKVIPPKGSNNLNVPDIIEATNKERTKAHLPLLKTNAKLNISAEKKARDMIDKGYFEHKSPTGVTVSDLGDQVGYDYIIMGENLALGDFKNADDLMAAWMASPGHRANILNPHYQDIGVSAFMGEYNGNYVWFAVQHFGTDKSVCPSINNATKKSIDSIAIQLKEKESAISTQRAILEAPKANLAPDYQKQVNDFNVLVVDYNNLLGQSQDLIKVYNAEVKSFNLCIKKLQEGE